VCDLETSRIGVPYIYDISHLRVKVHRYKTKHLYPKFNVYRDNGEKKVRYKEPFLTRSSTSEQETKL
jgi:hypothetical protein